MTKYIIKECRISEEGEYLEIRFEDKTNVVHKQTNGMTSDAWFEAMFIQHDMRKLQQINEHLWDKLDLKRK